MNSIGCGSQTPTRRHELFSSPATPKHLGFKVRHRSSTRPAPAGEFASPRVEFTSSQRELFRRHTRSVRGASSYLFGTRGLFGARRAIFAAHAVSSGRVEPSSRHTRSPRGALRSLRGTKRDLRGAAEELTRTRNSPGDKCCHHWIIARELGIVASRHVDTPNSLAAQRRVSLRCERPSVSVHDLRRFPSGGGAPRAGLRATRASSEPMRTRKQARAAASSASEADPTTSEVLVAPACSHA
jgi:hypothetical protein